MTIKLIDFGGKAPQRAHFNDVGADVFTNEDAVLQPYEIKKIPLGIGLELPDGLAGLILPRSGMSSKEGITTELSPIDPGYRGEINAIVFNANPDVVEIPKGTRIAQLVIFPVILAQFSVNRDTKERGIDAFGSTGNK